MMQRGDQLELLDRAPLAPELGIDDRGMMDLIGAIIAQAAIDYVDQRPTTGGALDAGIFLDAAGMLDRAPVIAAYAPRATASRKGAQRRAVLSA